MMRADQCQCFMSNGKRDQHPQCMPIHMRGDEDTDFMSKLLAICELLLKWAGDAVIPCDSGAAQQRGKTSFPLSRAFSKALTGLTRNDTISKI